MVMARVMVHAFNILHCLVIIAIGRAPAAGKVRDFTLYIDLVTLQQLVDDPPQFQIPFAPVSGVARLVLGFGLKPEEVPLGAGGEFEDVDAAIFRLSVSVWGECSIRGNHDQIQLRF
jgi:hypothetical protein